MSYFFEGHERIVSEEKCVKRAGEFLKFDPNIKLFIDPRGGPMADDYDYCADHLALYSTGVGTCSWNGRFRDAHPLSFRIRSPSGRRLQDLIQLVEVYRNGSLAYRTDVASDIVIINGNALGAYGIPHLADFDLRLYPAGIELDQELLQREVRRVADKFRGRIDILASVAFEEFASPDLKGDAKCVVARVDAIRAQLATLAGDPAPSPNLQEQAPPSCRSERTYSSLQKQYEELKGLAADKLKRRSDEIADRVRDDLSLDAQELRITLDKLWKKYKDANDTKAADTMRRIDGLVVETLGAIDDARVLATRVRDDLLSVAKDDRRQLAIFRSVVKSLQDEGDFFEPYGSNPPVLKDEVVVHMKYADALQIFILAPWKGAAFRFAEGPFHTEPGLSYAIPILDAVGTRLQFGRTRWADARAGLGMMVFEDSDQDAAKDAREVRLAVQANLSLANLRVGMAWVPAAEDESQGYFGNHFRLLLGLDLYKLLTGRNLEVKNFE